MDNSITVIALTATPPYDSTPAEWERYSKLCGDIDAEIFVPQLVVQNTLCPHQDYIYFNYPDKAEYDLVNAHRQKAIEVTNALMQEKVFSRALTDAGILPDYKAKEAVILEHPRAFAAILTCILNGEDTSLPKGLIRLISPKGGLPPYRMLEVEEALSFILDAQDIFPESLQERLSKRLSSAGLIERKKICLATTDKLKKMLLSSVGKLDSIMQITEAEGKQMGSDLRMLILTDHIRKELMGSIGTDEPLRSMGTVPIFESIRRRMGNVIPLAVLTGSLIIIPHTALATVTELAHKAGISLRAKALHDTGYDELIMSGSNKHKVGVMTEAFAMGCFCVLIGTTSLLGEGWDSPCINALILASFVGSFMLSNQMRGRAIRTDKNNPQKTSNIWHLVTVEPPLTLPEIARRTVQEESSPIPITYEADGAAILGEDYATIVRRFEGFLAPAYHKDMIENGIERLDVIKPPFDKDGIAHINHEMLVLAADRNAMADKWHSTLGDNMTPEISRANEIPADLAPKQVFFHNILSAAAATVPVTTLFTQSLITLASTGSAAGLIITVPLGMLYLYGLTTWVPKIASHCSPAKSIKTLANAILKTLKDLALIESPKARVQILPNDNQGSVICTLRNAGEHEKSVFSTAMSELLSPIVNPRYVIVKKMQFFKYSSLLYNESFTCPSVIANKKENVACLAKHLSLTTGHFEPVYTRNEEGREILLRCRKNSYINRNQKAIRGKRIVRSKWD